MLTTALAIASRALGGLLGLLGRIPAVGWLVLALAAWGWYGQQQAAAMRTEKAAAVLAASKAAITASESARKREQQLSTTVLEISDELQQAQSLRDAASRDAARRLRQLADAERARTASSAALAACLSYEGPAVAVLHDSTRDALVDLSQDADEVTAQLRGAQAYIRDVCLAPGR